MCGRVYGEGNFVTTETRLLKPRGQHEILWAKDDSKGLSKYRMRLTKKGKEVNSRSQSSGKQNQAERNLRAFT